MHPSDLPSKEIDLYGKHFENWNNSKSQIFTNFNPDNISTDFLKIINDKIDNPLFHDLATSKLTLRFFDARDYLIPRLVTSIHSSDLKTKELGKDVSITLIKGIFAILNSPNEKIGTNDPPLLSLFESAAAKLKSIPEYKFYPITSAPLSVYPAVTYLFGNTFFDIMAEGDLEDIRWDDPTSLNDQDLIEEIERIKLLIEQLREEVSEWRIRVDEGTAELPGPTVRLDILTRYLEQLYVEYNNRLFTLLALSESFMRQRILDAVQNGNTQAATAVLIAWSPWILMFTWPYLRVPLGCLQLAVMDTIALSFRFMKAGVAIVTRGYNVVRLLTAFTTRYGIPAIYETLIGLMLRNINVVIALQQLGYYLGDKVMQDPTIVSDIEDLKNKLLEIYENGSIPQEDIQPILDVIEFIKSLGK